MILVPEASNQEKQGQNPSSDANCRSPHYRDLTRLASFPRNTPVIRCIHSCGRRGSPIWIIGNPSPSVVVETARIRSSCDIIGRPKQSLSYTTPSFNGRSKWGSVTSTRSVRRQRCHCALWWARPPRYQAQPASSPIAMRETLNWPTQSSSKAPHPSFIS